VSPRVSLSWEVAVPAGAELGERPFWDAGQACLMWVDINAGQLLCLTTAWEGMTGPQRAAEPLAGHVLRARPGARGHPALAFGG
jgi:sugar lactone lactonase YvrE